MRDDCSVAPIAGSARPLSAPNSAPAQASFTPDGKYLVVTEKATNIINTYRVNPNGTLGAPRSQASAQPTPFGFRPLDFGDLRSIAETTGGQFFQPKSDEDLKAVYERIDELEKTELEDPRYRTLDRFEWPLGVGLALLLLAVCADVLLFRRVP